MRTVFCDIDGVTANMLPEWIRWYNLEYTDFLTVEKITHWNIHDFVKPECGMKMYNYLDDPRLYNQVLPMEGSLKGVQFLRSRNWRVVFATTTPRTTPYRKFDWLIEHGFEPSLKDYIEIQDKSLLSGYGNRMLDDNYENVSKFGGKAFLFSQNHNLSKYFTFRVNNWSDFCEKEWT